MKPMTEAHLAILRRHMVEVIALQADLMSEEIGKDILGERVLEPMRRVRRHLFVPPELAAMAYHDTPLPIGFDKTVSQPFICALMTDLLDPQPHEAVLEVGTGLGYQAAVLAELARDDAVLSAQYCLDHSGSSSSGRHTPDRKSRIR